MIRYARSVRQYGQTCALARALDLIGDRWTLLIVRELSIRACRYTDIRDGLSGIATNLLSERLKSLESAGIITTEMAPPPIAAKLYRLSDRGEELIPIISLIGRWGEPLMADVRPDDEFRPRWIVPAARSILTGLELSGVSPLEVVLEVDREPITIFVGHDRIDVNLGDRPQPDLRIQCDGAMSAALISGATTLDDAVAAGAATVTGNSTARARFRRLAARANASVKTYSASR
jgi:DNA-binding HxlR family transcriptional regulator